MDKSCDTCLYDIRVEDNKLGCRYPGICHTQDGKKTAWTPNKTAQYADLKGRRFRPTFSSNIDFFEIRGYDTERDMVLTTAHPKSGSAFDDEIEERYLAGAFENGEYVALPMAAQPGETVYVLHNYNMPETTRAVRQQKFCGPSCARCHHRFGTTSNAAWCETHWQQSRCYRFKLEKQ
jgi:hypothetical protein